MRVLVTNDDGVLAPGIKALALALANDGHDVTVVAPATDCSGFGAAIGDLGSRASIKVGQHSFPENEAIAVHSLASTPAMCVLVALLGAFGDPPDLVVAGVNPGNNTGRAVLHSGTVGAALTASTRGLSALAVSVGWAEDPQFEAAAEVAAAAVSWLVAAPAKTVLNLNIPDLPLEELKGCRWATLAPLGTVRAALRSSTDDEVQITLVEAGVDLPVDSDTALVKAGYVAVTCLASVRADDWLPVAAQIDRRLKLRASNRGSRDPAAIEESA